MLHTLWGLASRDSTRRLGLSGLVDYCNSLLHGTSQRNFDRLQRVQNSLSRVVTQADC